MDDDLIWVLDRSEGGAFVPLLATGRTFTFRSWRLGSPKTVHRGRTTAVPAVLVYLTLKLSNPSLQMSVFSTEFGDGVLLFCTDALEIIDECEKNRDILDGVLGKRSILNSCSGIGDISSHYILFGCHNKKIFRLGLNSYDAFFSSVFPDKNRTVRTEVIQHDDQPFSWVCLPEFFEHLANVFFFGSLPKGDDGVAIDRKDAKGVGSNLLSVFYLRRVPK